jgi:hypothetical protein
LLAQPFPDKIPFDFRRLSRCRDLKNAEKCSEQKQRTVTAACTVRFSGPSRSPSRARCRPAGRQRSLNYAAALFDVKTKRKSPRLCPGLFCFEAKRSVTQPVELPDQRSADGLNIFFMCTPVSPLIAAPPNVRSFDEKVEKRYSLRRNNPGAVRISPLTKSQCRHRGTSHYKSSPAQMHPPISDGPVSFRNGLRQRGLNAHNRRLDLAARH